MPTKTYYRIWCKKCNEFTLHNKSLSEENYICDSCKTVYTDIMLKDIPKDKLITQRQRYNDQKSKDLLNMVNFMSAGFFNNNSVEIIESDAGQKIIDQKINEKYKKLKEEQIEKEKLQKQYSKLGRNELCFCGSGVKFKKCCYNKIYI